MIELAALCHAPQAACDGLLADFRSWRSWSPWEGLDPDLSREYTGPDHGVGRTAIV